jgi:hypothetical protein
MSATFLVAGLMIVAGVLVIGSILMVRNKQLDPTEPSTEQGIQGERTCNEICSGDAKEDFDECFALCAYGWP